MGRARSARSRPTTDRPTGSRSIYGIAFGLVFGLLFVLSLRSISSLDAGFHLRTGAYILAGHLPPRVDPFSFTMKDHAYIDTSWGYDVMVAMVERVAGAPGLVLLHAGLVLTIFGLLLLTMRSVGADPLSALMALLAGALASEMRFEVRPELVSYTLLALVLLILHRHAEGRRSPLWALVPIHLLWANMHGLFPLGWGAIACFVAGMALRTRGLDVRLLGWGAASVAVTLVNPYGLRGLLFPLTLMTRLSGDNPFARSIGEFVSPFALGLSRQYPFYPWAPIASFRLLLVLAVIALVPLLVQKRFWSVLLAAGSAVLAYSMIRNLPIFVIAALPGIAAGLPLGALIGRLGLGPRARDRTLSALAALAGAVALIAGLRVLNDAYYIASRRLERFGWGWNRLALPVDAAAFADHAGLTGPMLNHLNFGGYLMWARTREAVFIDGRLEVVGERFYAEYRRILQSESALEEAAKRYGLRWLVFPYAGAPELLGRLSRDPRWTLVYRDHLAAIFVRKGSGSERLVDPALARELGEAPASGPHTNGLPGLGGAPRPTGATVWLRGLARRAGFPSAAFNKGLFHIYRGELERAGGYFVRAAQESGGAYREVYSNLGAVLYRQRRWADAAACYRVVLDERPGDPLAKERLVAIDRAAATAGPPPRPSGRPPAAR